jgi:hypothetical protein
MARKKKKRKSGEQKPTKEASGETHLPLTKNIDKKHRKTKTKKQNKDKETKTKKHRQKT